MNVMYKSSDIFHNSKFTILVGNPLMMQWVTGRLQFVNI